MTRGNAAELGQVAESMQPRDVDLNRCLVATFGKAELEQAAMLLLGLMAETNEWAEVRRVDLIEFARARAPRRWVVNPFFRPDLAGLMAKGFVAFRPGENTDNDDRFEFTEKALELLRLSQHCKGSELLADGGS